MVIALAGRRIDSEDYDVKRFPLTNVSKVEKEMEVLFYEENVTRLICSGANGADLIAIKAAHSLGISCTMVLPFDHKTFKKVSVMDRPGNWEDLFDKYYDYLNTQNNVKILNLPTSDPYAFNKTSTGILDCAAQFSHEENTEIMQAVVVWDGRPKDTDDATFAFYSEAQQRNIPVIEIMTI